MKHGRGWEGATPGSDAGCGVQHGCPCVGAASEFFFFMDSHQLRSIRAELD